jgi:hypothetical protein
VVVVAVVVAVAAVMVANLVVVLVVVVVVVVVVATACSSYKKHGHEMHLHPNSATHEHSASHPSSLPWLRRAASTTQMCLTRARSSSCLSCTPTAS